MYPVNGSTFTLSTHPLIVQNVYDHYQMRLALHDIDKIEIFVGNVSYCTIPNFIRDEPIVPAIPAVYTVAWTVPYVPGQTHAVVHYWRPPVSPVWQEQ